MTNFPLRLRPGVHVAPADGGLSITGLGRILMMPGPTELSATWDLLFPGLHAGEPVDELLAVLPEADRPTGRAILRALHEAGLLLDARKSAAVDERERDRFHRTISYLEARAAEPYQAFRLLRATTVLVSGGGQAALAAGRALLRAGVGGLMLADAEATELAEVAAEVDIPLNAGAPQVIVTVDAEAPPAGGLPWFGVLLAGELALVGPGGVPDSEQATLVDTVTRHRQRTGIKLTPAPTSPVAAALAGNLAALQVVDRLADVPDANQAHVVTVTGMRVTRHPVSRPRSEDLNTIMMEGRELAR